jgi:hypothetical protein|tara:strand:- start:75 stop:311 length:237 start_codon:yes stop_codon:yes gene_type:complete
MSAEQEAIDRLNEVFTIIKDTLEEANKDKRDSRKLTDAEKAAISEITNKLKQVRTNLSNYLKTFRVQTSLQDFNTGQN